MRVLVVGGGVIGCSVAYHLQRAGLQVTVAERDRVGSGASSAAAGMLAPLAESAEPGPFAHLAQLGLQSFHERAAELVEESGVDFEYRRDGILRVAESEQEEQELRSVLPWQQQTGSRVTWIERNRVIELEPGLSPTIRGALYTEAEGHVNPGRLTEALATAAKARGATFIEGCSIRGFDHDRGRVTAARHRAGRLSADYIVIAGGAWAGASDMGLDVVAPVFPVKGQMAALSQVDPLLRHIVYSHSGYLVPKAGGSIYVGATEEEQAGFDASVTAVGLHWLLGAALRLLPPLGAAAYLRSWAGLRPCSPDRMPILGPVSSYTNVAVATGHFRNGILLSLITGQLIADLVQSGRTPPEISTFTPERFHSPK
jgi:glycine oxidase